MDDEEDDEGGPSYLHVRFDEMLEEEAREHRWFQSLSSGVAANQRWWKAFEANRRESSGIFEEGAIFVLSGSVWTAARTISCR